MIDDATKRLRLTAELLAVDGDRRARIQAKLWAKSIYVDRGYISPCHEWTGPTSGNGRGGLYGRMSLDGATVATHIASWTNSHGLIPPRKQLDHKCCNRRCWREDHLELLTHKKNQKARAKRAKAAVKGYDLAPYT